MRFRLEYGREGPEVELPGERIVRTLQYKDAIPLFDPAASVREVLQQPLGSEPLSQPAALETIKTGHGPRFIAHPKADCGILDGNPVHEENSWIAEHVGCDFIVYVVLDGR